MAQALFYILAAIALLGGLGVIVSRQPIRSVLSLVMTMLALSGLFLMLSAQFVFAVQVIVYAGAVMVLFLFVVALLGPAREGPGTRLRIHWAYTFVVAAPLVLGLWLLLQGVEFRKPDSTGVAVFGTVEQIGYGLFTTYLWPFELTSVMLLVAAVGAIYLSRGRIAPHGGADSARASGPPGPATAAGPEPAPPSAPVAELEEARRG